MNCWNTLRALQDHNVAGDGRRDGLKTCGIGQSAAKGLLHRSTFNDYSERKYAQVRRSMRQPLKAVDDIVFSAMKVAAVIANHIDGFVSNATKRKYKSDYGRSKGVAWYYLGGFGIVHTLATNCRIVKWDSAA